MLIGVVYIASRCVGKYFGARISSKMVKSDENIVKYLGITLFAVLIYEIVGPALTKMSLLKAGEIDPEGAVSERKKDAK